ncbi:hypothetical protein BDW74DRAFT_146023 [Aspergillus multicolor]|uniref:uncharacterized protein n=1 Tax=Aspergillus multicolor TaxID=41759 RepID=UPI003CCCEFCF
MGWYLCFVSMVRICKCRAMASEDKIVNERALHALPSRQAEKKISLQLLVCWFDARSSMRFETESSLVNIGLTAGRALSMTGPAKRIRPRSSNRG